MTSKEEAFKLDVVSVRLVRETPLISKQKINSPEAAVHVLGELMCEMDREVLFAINLNNRNEPINGTMVSMGSINQSIASPREIFKASILSNAARIILLHNHPSGDLTPSKDDISVTNRLLKAGDVLEIPLMDHIIVGGVNSHYFSFMEKGILRNSELKYSSNINDLNFKQRSKDIFKERDSVYMKYIKNYEDPKSIFSSKRNLGMDR